MSLPLQDPGADGAHGVWGGAEAVLGHMVLQHLQSSLVLAGEDKINQSHCHVSSPAGVGRHEGPAPHHLGLAQVVKDLAQPGDGAGHGCNTLHTMVLSRDAHHTGLPSLTEASN